MGREIDFLAFNFVKKGLCDVCGHRDLQWACSVEPVLTLRRGLDADLLASLLSDSSGGSDKGLDVAVKGLDGTLASPAILSEFIPNLVNLVRN